MARSEAKCVFSIDGITTKAKCMIFRSKDRVCVFVIDGKDHDQQHNDDRMERSEAKLHFGYQKLNSISEFQIPGVGSVETLHHRNAEM
jgi:hypothetical protein